MTGTDAAARSAWCARVVRRDDLEEISSLLSFAQHAGEAQRFVVGEPEDGKKRDKFQDLLRMGSKFDNFNIK